MSESKKSKSASSGAVTSLDDLLAIEDVQPTPVYVPQWKRTVYLRPPVGTEIDYYEQLTDPSDEKGKPRIVENVRSELVARCLCSEAGEFFANTRAEINLLVQQLNAKNSAALRVLYGECKKVAGIVVTQAEVDALKNGSSAAPAAASGSGSPGSGAAPSENSAAAA